MHEPPFEPEEGGVFEGVGVVGVPGGVVGVPGGVVGTTAPPPPRAKPRPGQTCPVPKDLAESHAVQASVAVDVNGKVTGVSILKDPGHGLGRAAKDCLLGWSFEPALDANGAPVDSKVIVVVRYEIN
jgi:protein TonB